MTPTVISFLPKHRDYTESQHDDMIAVYRAWLDQHGRYGKLYMMKINNKSWNGAESNPGITGVDIYEYDIAVLFKLTFEV